MEMKLKTTLQEEICKSVFLRKYSLWKQFFIFNKIFVQNNFDCSVVDNLRITIWKVQWRELSVLLLLSLTLEPLSRSIHIGKPFE